MGRNEPGWGEEKRGPERSGIWGGVNGQLIYNKYTHKHAALMSPRTQQLLYRRAGKDKAAQSGLNVSRFCRLTWTSVEVREHQQALQGTRQWSV